MQLMITMTPQVYPINPVKFASNTADPLSAETIHTVLMPRMEALYNVYLRKEHRNVSKSEASSYQILDITYFRDTDKTKPLGKMRLYTPMGTKLPTQALLDLNTAANPTELPLIQFTPQSFRHGSSERRIMPTRFDLSCTTFPDQSDISTTRPLVQSNLLTANQKFQSLLDHFSQYMQIYNPETLEFYDSNSTTGFRYCGSSGNW